MTCPHLAALGPVDPEPLSKDGCIDCLAEGRDDWVHLRLCLECGHVGCCDSSPQRHASKHFADSQHPVVRSFEPGEVWRWCFVDEIVG
jgi:uncharacterized UBP type Zn finger protein